MLLRGGTQRATVRQQLVEGVERALTRRYRHSSRLFEQIRAHSAAAEGAARVETDLNPPAEAARIVVTESLGVAEGLEDRVGLEQHRLHAAGAEGAGGALVVVACHAAGARGEALKQNLGRFRLPCA